ncbi:MAG: methanogenesis marker 14 protein [Candidatus Thorarchaeota archaeon]|nr:methanogenesis marker 14 protein [Candidatus Thorarchaeota archaeon]
MRNHVKVLKPRSIGISSTRMGPYYTVASVELGNTTTKCILSTTNLRTAEIFQIAKEVRFTRDVRPPTSEEQVFGETLVGVRLTRASVSEMIAATLTSVLESVGMDLERDLHFVVRSTGVTAGFSSPNEVGEMVQALAEGCLKAGVPPRKMTASLSPDTLPPGLQDYTWLKRVYFDGAVASSLPPADASVVANEMEGELVTAGIKGAVKGTDIDFRNPVMTLDFGTTLAGRVTDESHPYAKTIGSFAGLAGAISDAIVRGSGSVRVENGTALDLPKFSAAKDTAIDTGLVDAVHRLIRVETIEKGTNRFGTVPVDPQAAEESGVVLMGIDAGKNGSNLPALEKIGRKIYQGYQLDGLFRTLDLVQARLVCRLVSLAEQHNLILDNTSLGLTGRSITTGLKPDIITSTLIKKDESLWVDKHQLVFVEDGLAMGAAVAARCMNSMGTHEFPMGGRKGDRCIMGARMKLQRKDKS